MEIGGHGHRKRQFIIFGLLQHPLWLQIGNFHAEPLSMFCYYPQQIRDILAFGQFLLKVIHFQLQ